MVIPNVISDQQKHTAQKLIDSTNLTDIFWSDAVVFSSYETLDMKHPIDVFFGKQIVGK